jgi:prephenate dehydratase
LKRLRVGFQGEHGAYSEQAIINQFGPDAVTVPNKSIREVFNLTEVEGIDLGVVPIENSIEGSVSETYDLLLTSSVKVVGEIVLRVVHCLVGIHSSRLEQIRFIYSHPQALAQCRGFVASLRAEPMITYDTAGSVKMIKEKGDPTAAAIASERAAGLYSMKVLAKGIEDYGRNYTRFLTRPGRSTRRSRSSRGRRSISPRSSPVPLASAPGNTTSS